MRAEIDDRLPAAFRGGQSGGRQDCNLGQARRPAHLLLYFFSAGRRYLFRDEPIEVIAASGNNGEIRFREERLAVFTSSFDAAKTSEYSLFGRRVPLRLSPAFDYRRSLGL